MKPDGVHMALLFDYYGDMLTQKQREYFELYYHHDLSLAEIAQDEGISRQGVHDTLLRAEAILENLEEKLGCVAKAKEQKQSLEQIRACADALLKLSDSSVRPLAGKILAALGEIKE